MKCPLCQSEIETMPNQKKGITILQIMKVVCLVYKTRIIYLESARKDKRITRIRFAAFLLCREYTRHSLPMIGNKFGGRDHTTIMHGLKRAEELLLEDVEFSIKYNMCVDKIRLILKNYERKLERCQKLKQETYTERECLRCHKPFTSKHVGNRICKRCDAHNKKHPEYEGMHV